MLFLSLLGPLHLRFLLELQICLWQLSISASFPLLLLPLSFPRFPSLKCWSHSLTSVSFILNSLSVAKFYRFYPLNVLYPVLPPPFFFLFAIIPIQTCTLSIGILKSILYNVDNFAAWPGRPQEFNWHGKENTELGPKPVAARPRAWWTLWPLSKSALEQERKKGKDSGIASAGEPWRVYPWAQM